MPSTRSLLGPNEVLVVADVVTAEEQAALVRWADEKCSAGRLLRNPQDQGGYLTPYQSSAGTLTQFTRNGPGPAVEGRQEFVWIPSVDERQHDPLPDAFWSVRARVVEWLRLGDLEEDPYKGSFLSYMAPGGEVHRHCDAKVNVKGEQCDILRCNILFRRPEHGGLPVIGGEHLDVPDRGMWAFFATELFHSATEVGGAEYRGTLSFGFLVRSENLWVRRFQLAEAVRTQFGLDQGEEMRRLLIARLRQAPDAAAIGGDRLALVEYALGAPGDFNSSEAAAALGAAPATVCRELIDLQRSGFVESVSSLSAERGTVWVL